MKLPPYSLVQSDNASYAIINKDDDIFYIFSALKEYGPSKCSFSVHLDQAEVVKRIYSDNNTKEISFQEFIIDSNFKGGKNDKRYKRAVSKYSFNADVYELSCHNNQCIKSLSGNNSVTNDNEIENISDGSDDDVIIEQPHISTNADRSVSQQALDIPPLSPPGLANFGNTCYMNSIVQCFKSVISIDMLNSANIYDYIGRCLTKLLKELHSKVRSIRPTDFRKTFSRVFPQLNANRQHDGHEFLMSLLDYLLKSNFANGFIKNECQREESSMVKCNNCGIERHTSVHNLCLSLPVTDTVNCSILDCLGKYFENEQMTNENGQNNLYACVSEQCKSQQKAVKSLQITKSY